MVNIILIEFKSIIQIHWSAGKSVYAGITLKTFGRNKAYVKY